MNDTVLALLSALAIYAVSSFAIPLGASDSTDDKAAAPVEDSIDARPSDIFFDDGPTIL